MNILIVGPFPNPLHGMSLANKILLDSFSANDNVNVKYHDTNLIDGLKDKSKQGQFILSLFFKAMINIFFCLYKILRCKNQVVYVTPGQSVYGLIRFLPVIFLAKIYSKRCVLHFHGSKLKDYISASNVLLQSVSLYTLNLADNVIFLGESIENQHYDLLKVGVSKVCNNGVNLPCGVSSKKLNGPLNVLFLSNLMRDKGIVDIFSAIELSNCNSVVFNFAGEIESDLKTLALDFFINNESFVKYHGVVDGYEKDKLLRDAHVLLLPSYDEGQPLCILEAYSYGCAVITTDVGGIKDVFEDGYNGFFCKKSDSISINNKIDKLIEVGIDEISINNLNLSKSKYSKEVFCSNILKVLKG